VLKSGEPAVRLQFAAAFEGTGKGDFVGVFQIRADGDAVGEAADLDAEGLEEAGEVHGGGFAFYGRVLGHDDFADDVILEASEELFDAKRLGPNTVEGGDDPM